MTAETPLPDLAACEAFAAFWCEATGAPHLTLTAITPDGPTTTASFARGEAASLRGFIAAAQREGRNLYFQPNETPPGCTSKPGKGAMVAALCRHADVDPDDARFPLAEERARLHRLAAALAADPAMPPTVILDSGNGIQPLWAVRREPLDAAALARVEAENRAVEAALGAQGTHDVSRLLRLPGTVNLPNRTKRARGRGATRARVLHQSGRTYTPDQMAGLGLHLADLLAGTDLVRGRHGEAAQGANGAHGAAAQGVGYAHGEAAQGASGAHGAAAQGVGYAQGEGAGRPDALLARLHAAMRFTPALATRWAGDTTGLKDASRSGLAMSLCALLKRAGFGREDAFRLLHLHPQVGPWCAEKGEAGGGRELARLWDRTDDADPADAPWPAPRRDLATAEPLPAPALDLALFPPAWAGWIGRAAAGAGAPPDYVACALIGAVGATIGNARWGSPWTPWAHPPVVNIACIGLPSAGKSPALNAVMGPLGELAADLNDDWEERLRQWRTDCQAAEEIRALWKADVKAAIKDGRPPPAEPPGAKEPERPHKRRILTTDATMEAARDLAAANPRGLLLHRDELAGWIAGMDRYGAGGSGTERAFWLQAYEGGRWTADRVKNGEDACDVAHLTWGIVGGIQPDRLASLLLSGDDDGLSARFLYTWPAAPSDVSPVPDGAPLPFDLKARLRRLRELPMPESGEPVILPFAADAVQEFQDFRRLVKAMEGEAAGLFLSWLGKLPGMAVRLAVIFLHLDWLARPAGTPPPERVDLDALARAQGFLADYAIPMARRAFGEAALPQAERDARTLARWLLRQSPLPAILNARELRRMAAGPAIPTRERMEAGLAELAELGWVRPAPGREGGSKGRQRADWAVNPKLRERAL